MRDAVRIARAVVTNQVARWSPATYLRLTGQTGRGAAAEETPGDIADYFRRCVHDYLERLDIRLADAEAFLRGKVVLEYGPGDLPGVAVLMVAFGAEKVYCVDRFPMVNISEKNAGVLRRLLDGLSGARRSRLLSCFARPEDFSAGFDPKRIEYVVKPHGLSFLHEAVDLVISRAVLEHVDDLKATFADMTRAMRPSATAIHLVDLKSHGFHKKNPLDFLECPMWLWHAMYSHKGVPNRWRIDRYRAILSELPVRIIMIDPTTRALSSEVAAVRSKLAQPFRRISDEDLACLGFWLIFEKC